MSDKNFSSVLFLTSVDGADAATAATDKSASARAITFVGTAQLDTAQAKWGASSLLLDGNSDYISLPDSNDWNFTGQFTVECWARLASLTAGGTSHTLASHYQVSGNLRSWWMRILDGGGEIQAVCSTDGTNVQTARYESAASTIDTWHHYAMTRDASNVIRIFRDGVVGNVTATLAGTLFNSSVPVAFGAAFNGGATAFTNGWLDEIRITNGLARYTGAFTPPRGPFSRYKSLGQAGDYRQPVVQLVGAPVSSMFMGGGS